MLKFRLGATHNAPPHKCLLMFACVRFPELLEIAMHFDKQKCLWKNLFSLVNWKLALHIHILYVCVYYSNGSYKSSKKHDLDTNKQEFMSGDIKCSKITTHIGKNQID